MDRVSLQRTDNPDKMVDFEVTCCRCGRKDHFAISERRPHPFKSSWERAWDQASSYGWRRFTVSYETEDAIVGDSMYFCSVHFPNSFVDDLLP